MNIKGDSLYHEIPAMFINTFISVNIYDVLWKLGRSTEMLLLQLLKGNQQICS